MVKARGDPMLTLTLSRLDVRLSEGRAVQVKFGLILDSSVQLCLLEHCASCSHLGLNPGHARGKQLVSFRNHFPVPLRYLNQNKYVCMCMYVRRIDSFGHFIWIVKFVQNYRAEMQNVDFSNDATRQGINQWVSDETNKKIENLLAKALGPMTRMILVNAIYFKGDWAKKFDAKDTKKEKFYRSDGSSVDVDMVNMKKKFSMDYIRDLKTKVLELPYKGESLSMIILLPDDKDGLAKLESALTADHLMKLRVNPHGRNDVVVALPRFISEESASLGKTLCNMGMGGIQQRPCWPIKNGWHTQSLPVEGGTQSFYRSEWGRQWSCGSYSCNNTDQLHASVGVPCRSSFSFMIRCNRTKSFLFMGKMENPPTARN